MTSLQDSKTWIRAKSQNQDFLKKIGASNQSQGRNIIAKYDWENSLLNVFKNCNDFDSVTSEIDNYFEKRLNFLNFMAKYL